MQAIVSPAHITRAFARSGRNTNRRHGVEFRPRRDGNTSQPAQRARHGCRVPPDRQFPGSRNAHADHPLILLRRHARPFPFACKPRPNEAGHLFEFETAGTELPSRSRTVYKTLRPLVWFRLRPRSRRCALALPSAVAQRPMPAGWAAPLHRSRCYPLRANPTR